MLALFCIILLCPYNVNENETSFFLNIFVFVFLPTELSNSWHFWAPKLLDVHIMCAVVDVRAEYKFVWCQRPGSGSSRTAGLYIIFMSMFHFWMQIYHLITMQSGKYSFRLLLYSKNAYYTAYHICNQNVNAIIFIAVFVVRVFAR